MKHARNLLILAVLLFTGMLPISVYAFDPPRLLWDQEGRLRVEFSADYVWTDKPAQLGKTAKSGTTISQEGLYVQYLIFEDENLGKLEVGVGLELSRHWDVYDLARVMADLGYTLGRFRIEIGHDEELNIGAAQPDRGLSAYWVGINAKLLERDTVRISGYARYLPKSDFPATIEERYAPSSDPLTFEVGFQMKWQFWKYALLSATPHLFLKDSLEPARVGLRAGLLYDIGQHVKFLPQGLSMELKPHYGINTDFKRDQLEIQAGLTWTWR